MTTKMQVLLATLIIASYLFIFFSSFIMLDKTDSAGLLISIVIIATFGVIGTCALLEAIDLLSGIHPDIEIEKERHNCKDGCQSNKKVPSSGS